LISEPTDFNRRTLTKNPERLTENTIAIDLSIGSGGSAAPGCDTLARSARAIAKRDDRHARRSRFFELRATTSLVRLLAKRYEVIIRCV
jgi:hypothetical protein